MMPQTPPPATQHIPGKVYFLMANEIAERFSYYGMSAILPMYLREQFFSGIETDANSAFHLFRSGVYFFPFLGAILADGLIGRYKTILNLSIVYVLGHALLALFPTNFAGFATGLFLIALASGGIKPNVSTFIGGQIPEADAAAKRKAFNILYFCINIGATLGLIFIPIVKDKWGPEIGFAAPGLAMLIALVIFWVPNKTYAKPAPLGSAEFGRLFSRETIRSVLKASTVFGFVIVFMALYEENASAWVFQAEHLDLDFLGFTFKHEQVQSTNGVFVLLLVPLFSFIVYPFLERRGFLTDLVNRVAAGFIFMLLAYGIIYGLQVAIEQGAHPAVAWQILAYFLLTIAEVMVNVSCLQLAYDRAAAHTKSIVTALFFLSISVGNLVGSGISSIIDGEAIGSNYYLILMVLMVVNTGAFALYRRRA